MEDYRLLQRSVLMWVLFMGDGDADMIVFSSDF
jgi:hypothetical protein